MINCPHCNHELHVKKNLLVCRFCGPITHKEEKPKREYRHPYSLFFLAIYGLPNKEVDESLEEVSPQE